MRAACHEMPLAGDREDLGRAALIHTEESAEDPERSSCGVAAVEHCRSRELLSRRMVNLRCIRSSRGYCLRAGDSDEGTR